MCEHYKKSASEQYPEGELTEDSPEWAITFAHVAAAVIWIGPNRLEAPLGDAAWTK